METRWKRKDRTHDVSMRVEANIFSRLVLADPAPPPPKNSKLIFYLVFLAPDSLIPSLFVDTQH